MEFDRDSRDAGEIHILKFGERMKGVYPLSMSGKQRRGKSAKTVGVSLNKVQKATGL